MRLTDIQIKRINPNTKPYKVSDGGGLYLWVTPQAASSGAGPTGMKGREAHVLREISRCVLSLARERHSEARKLLATGIDPMAERKAEKAATGKFLQKHCPPLAGTLAGWQKPAPCGLREAPHGSRILPCLGARPIAEIEAPELVAMTKAIEQRGARDIAKRALETTGQVFRYAIAHGYAKRNPASEIRPSDILKSTRKVNYARVDAKELPALLRAIEVYQGTHVTRLAMKLMALTFVRTSELIGAKWEEFDLEAARWDIPAERMKMRTPHIVPLAKQTLEVLELLRTLTGKSEWLFPGDRNAKKPMSNNTILKALGAHGIQGPHDRPRLPWAGLHHPA